MSKNILNKNTILYNTKNKKNNLNIIILISMYLGWIVLPVTKIKNKNISNILFSYSKLYKFFFKLKGFGYKWKHNLHLKKNFGGIFLKLGFTHRIAIIIKKNIKYKLNKKRFVIKSRSLKFIRNNLNYIFFLYKSYIYNKKGIYLRGTLFKTKISKKKSKF